MMNVFAERRQYVTVLYYTVQLRQYATVQNTQSFTCGLARLVYAPMEPSLWEHSGLDCLGNY